MKSDSKSFQVFDFTKEDELAELTSAKLLSKYTNPSAIDKYSFLENGMHVWDINVYMYLHACVQLCWYLIWDFSVELNCIVELIQFLVQAD